MFVSTTTAIAVYISTIVIGAFSTALFYSIDYYSLKRPKETTVLWLSGAFILYLVFELISTVFYATPYLQGLYFLPKAISDLGFFAFVILWLQILQELTGRLYPLRIKGIIVITIIYFVIVEFLVFVHADIIKLSIPDSTSEIIIRCLNTGFDLLIPLMAVYQLFALRRSSLSSINVKVTALLSILLTLYMLSTLYFDIIGYRNVVADKMYVRLDYIIILYLAACIVLTVQLISNFQESRMSSADRKDTIDLRWKAFVKKYDITKRELDIIQLLQYGYENNVIAEKSFISENTVKRHLNHIFSKTNTKSKYELLALIINEILK